MTSRKDEQRPKPSDLLRSPDLNQLNCEVEDILSKEGSHPYSFITSIQQRIRQYHLEGGLEPHEVIHEAYIRAVRFIQGGGKIKVPKAWLRTTCFNIISEKSREQSKHLAIDTQSIQFEKLVSAQSIADFQDNQGMLTASALSPLTIQQRMDLFQRSLEILGQRKPEAAQLMVWRLLKNHSWKAIRRYLVRQNGTAPEEATLRKQASRAKRELRRIYHELEEELQGARCK